MKGHLRNAVLYCGLVLVPCWIVVHQDKVAPRPDFPIRSGNTIKSVAPEKFSIKAWHGVEGISESIAQFETVFWEPRDTDSLRHWLWNDQFVAGKRILEIGTGTGLLAVTALLAGATSVIATDINPAAVANANYNAHICEVHQRIEIRQVSKEIPGPFEVIGQEERFDIILSNPPWEDAPVQRVDQYALYDPSMALCDGLLEEGQRYLHPGGVMWLAYGAKSAIYRILEQGPKHDWSVTVRDDRMLDDLPEVFLPAMLIELKPLSHSQHR